MTSGSRLDDSRLNSQAIINLTCAAIMFISPWALGFATVGRAAWTAWTSGVVIGVMAIAALLQFAEWEEWVSLVFGVAVGASPWVLGFATSRYAAIVCVVLGIVVALSSISVIWTMHHQAHVTTEL
jgi:SPW repeat